MAWERSNGLSCCLYFYGIAAFARHKLVESHRHDESADKADSMGQHSSDKAVHVACRVHVAGEAEYSASRHRECPGAKERRDDAEDNAGGLAF